MAQSAPIQFRDKDIEKELTVRAGSQSLGMVAQTALTRYFALLQRSLPRLTSREWCAIFDACNGTWWDNHSLGLLWANIADSEGLSEKWQIDQEGLAQCLRRLSYAECAAVVDAAERFWSSATQPGEDGWRGVVAQIVGEPALVD